MLYWIAHLLDSSTLAGDWGRLLIVSVPLFSQFPLSTCCLDNYFISYSFLQVGETSD